MFNVGLYYRTLKYLKPVQLAYRVWYKIRPEPKFNPVRPDQSQLGVNLTLKKVNDGAGSASVRFIENEIQCRFLNLEKRYPKKDIQWNDISSGKLWNFNLNYFEYLESDSLSDDQKLFLIKDFAEKSLSITYGMEAYPISLRGINWIKFFIHTKADLPDVRTNLYSQYVLLTKKTEFDVLGNHLLENAFSLLFASFFFNERKFYRRAHELLTRQLEEQILKDGAHFELSPMYHQIILFRLLDSINIMSYNDHGDKEFYEFLLEKASLMCGWLRKITFSNGDIPMVNDSSWQVAPDTKSILDYARRLSVPVADISLSDSGYRKFTGNKFELFCDAGPIGPDYLPAHAHADSLNYVLYYDGTPVITDPGVSTYEGGNIRGEERSTVFHNTVTINDKNSSEVWSIFRVGERAVTRVLNESDNSVKAVHDGYKSHFGALHSRVFNVDEKSITIADHIEKIRNGIEFTTISNLHFHPDCKPSISGNRIHIGDLEIVVEGAEEIQLEKYRFAKGYNKHADSDRVRITFKSDLSVTFKAL